MIVIGDHISDLSLESHGFIKEYPTIAINIHKNIEDVVCSIIFLF